jgi:hypothetical protein
MSIIFNRIKWIWSYVLHYAIVLAAFGFAFHWLMSLTGWVGILTRSVLILSLFSMYAFEITMTLHSWKPVKKLWALFITQFAFIGLYIIMLWQYMAGQFETPLNPFLKSLRGSIPYYLHLYLKPSDISQTYLGLENPFIMLLIFAALVIAAVIAVTVNVNAVKMIDEMEATYHEATDAVSYAVDVKTTYTDGSTSTNREMRHQGARPAYWSFDNDPEDRMFLRVLLSFFGYIFAPLLTFTIVMIYNFTKIFKSKFTKVILITVCVIMFAGVLAAAKIGERNDIGAIPRDYTAAASQVETAINEWNAHSPELFDNYSLNVKRIGRMFGDTVKQVKEDSRTLRYYNIRDRKMTDRGEYWVVTDGDGTVIYRKRKGEKLVYKPGSNMYDRLMRDLDLFMLETITGKDFPLYKNESPDLKTDNSARNNKLILSAPGKGIPADYYLTDNIVTVYDFYMYNQKFRTKVTYGKAKISLPGYIVEYIAAGE